MEFESMSKSDLESHGRTIGIELDRRLVKSQLIAQLQEFITLKKIEEEFFTQVSKDDDLQAIKARGELNMEEAAKKE